MAYFEIYYHDKVDVSVFEDAPPPSNNDFRVTNIMRFNIDGYFATALNREYLRDIAYSMTKNMNSQLMKIVYHSYHETNGVSYKLCDFDSIKRKKVNINSHGGLSMESEDEMFEILRAHSHKLYHRGVKNMEQELNAYGCMFTNDWKKVSYKARAIQKHYDNGGTAGRVKLTDMNRAENAKHQSYSRSRNKFNQFSRYFKLFGSTSSISSIAKHLKMDRKTIRKYLLKINIMDKYASFSTSKNGEETNALRGMLLVLQEKQLEIRETYNMSFNTISIDAILKLIQDMFYLYKPIDTHNLHTNYTSLTQKA